jgi:hypothetical protein
MPPGASHRKTLVLAGVLAGLGALALLLEGPWQAGRRAEREPAAAVDTAGADQIAIGAGEKAVTLRKVQGTWQVQGEGVPPHPADPDAPGKALEWLKDVAAAPVVSRNPAFHGDYKLDGASALPVRIQAGDRVLAELLVGSQGPDLFSTYVRKKGGDEVLLARGYMRPYFERPARSWRDLTVLSFREEEVREIRLAAGGRSLTLTREGKEWTASPGGKPQGEGDAAGRLVNRLSSLKGVEIAQGPPDPGIWAAPALVAEVARTSGATDTLTVGAELEGQGRHPARLSGRETVYLLGAGTVEELTTPLR